MTNKELKADLARYKDLADTAKRYGFSGHKKPRNMIVGSQYQRLRELALMGNLEAIDAIKELDRQMETSRNTLGRYPSPKLNFLKRLFKTKSKPENKVYYNKEER